MKKLLITLLLLLMLCGCSSSKKEVSSSSAFSTLGVSDFYAPEDVHITDVKYYIVDKKIAEIDFINSGHQYIYRASKELGVGSILDIESNPTESISSTIEGISYSLASYPEGLSAIWIKDLTTYSLFGEGLSVDSNYEFYRVIELITGINTTEDTIMLPTIDGTVTKDYIMEWFKDNDFKDVDYIYDSSDTVKEGYVISLSKQGEVHPSDEIICTISTGPKKPETVTVPDNMINNSEKDFVDTLTKLGMGYTKGSRKYYSTTIKKDHIFDYDDGIFPVGTIIKYHLSNGPYEFDSESYNGLTKDEANKYIEELNKLNAHVELKLEDHETNNHPAGKIYRCTGNKDGAKTIVSCRLALTPTTDTRVDLPNYVGTYNNPCGNTNACTLNQINYMIDYVNDGNPVGYVSAQTVPAGKVDPGTCVKLVITSSMGYLRRVESGYYSKFEGNNFMETEDALMGSDAGLALFNNIEFETVCDFSKPNATVVEIQVFDENTKMWTADYQEGNYSRYTKIKVIINDPRVF